LLEIQYTGLNLARAGAGAFSSTRLEGHETAWDGSPAALPPRITTKLSPGDYRFHVIACNEDGFLERGRGQRWPSSWEPPFWAQRGGF